MSEEPSPKEQEPSSRKEFLLGEHRRSSHISVAERGIALAMAIAVLVTFIVLVLYPRSMSSATFAIVRFLAVTFAGIAGYLFVGNLGLAANIPFNKTQVRATGAFASFVLVMFFFGFALPELTPISPSPVASTGAALPLVRLKTFWESGRKDNYPLALPTSEEL